MTYRTLYIGRWTVDFLFAGEHYDKEEVLGLLYDMGASFHDMSRAKELVSADKPNTGFTYPDYGTYEILVVIGPTTSSEEFINTLTHEIHHVAVIIASELGIDLEDEVPAYISGDAMRDLADVVCRMGCPHCHKD